MKAVRNLILAAAALLALASCSDSHDKLAKDQISYMEEMTRIIDEVADGKLSSADATARIKKWGEDGEAIQTRKKALLAKSTPEELEAIRKKHAPASAAAMKEFITALQKLHHSGRVTPEILSAVENVKN